jgi:hypothetical protein
VTDDPKRDSQFTIKPAAAGAMRSAILGGQTVGQRGLEDSVRASDEILVLVALVRKIITGTFLFRNFFG